MIQLEQLIKKYQDNKTQVYEGLNFSQKDLIKQIEFITNSKYMTQSTAGILAGKDKRPYYNVTNFRVNVATRATDIDTKDIQVVSDNPQNTVRAKICSKEVYEWMKEENFAKTLNEMGETRARYGTVLVKKCEEQEEGEEDLEIDVVDWRNTIVHPVEISKFVAEKHYMDAYDLSKKADVWDNVPKAMEAAEKNSKGSILVYEVTTYLPENYKEMTGEYKLQRIFFSPDLDDNYSVLSHDYLDEFPYKYCHWQKVNGRSIGRGIVEDGLEAQRWTNDAMIRQTQALEVASKVIFKSKGGNIANNILTDLENGDIVDTSTADIEPLNMLTNSMPQFGNVIEQWNQQYERISSTFNAVTGENMPASTPYRAVAVLNQEANSMFDYRREEFGIFLVELFTDWVLPFLSKKFSKEHILNAEFSPEELQQIDNNFATYTATKQTIEKVLKGEIVTPEEYQKSIEAQKELLKITKNNRFLEVEKGVFDPEFRMTIITTGEQKNKAVMLESLNNILMTIAKSPNVLQDKSLQKIFGRILELSGAGLSAADLIPEEQPQPDQPTQAQAMMEQLSPQQPQQ